MPLRDYKAKRRFENTPEPRGDASRKIITDNTRHFVVQKHRASHLHYDFRLEFEGILKSWAVPKGPSMNPDDKRLAMMVEDHPLDYRNFEGVVPRGNYGAGTVEIWDKGFYYAEDMRAGLKKGHIDFVILGDKLKGLFSLIQLRGKKAAANSWLLIKQKDKYGTDTKVVQTDPIPAHAEPMLAKLTDKPFSDSNWVFENKWDGYRIIATVADSVNLRSRGGLDYTEKFRPISDALVGLHHTAILDGEVIALNNQGKPEFQLLQDYEIRPVPLAYAIFDLLYLDGEDLRNRPLIERKALLEKIINKQSPALIYSSHIEKNGSKFFEKIVKGRGEGVIAKRKDSVYESKRSNNWLKIKIARRQEAIICGFTKPRKSRKHFGALILGMYENRKLIYTGHTGTGFNDQSLRSVHQRLSKIITKNCPFASEPETNEPATWVKPQLICEIKFSEWTNEGLMRHPVFMGLREDKHAREVKIEIPVHSHEQTFTHKNKVFWKKEGYTKGNVLDYYERISPIILPYLKDRPESLSRHPNGPDGKNFFQKDSSNLHLPDFVETYAHTSDDSKKIKYILCQNKETLLYLANLGCIELNPWNSRVSKPDNPDYMIIDLDPGGRSFGDLITVAREFHKLLESIGAQSDIKTSGKKGLHICVPLKAAYTYETVRLFSQLLVQIIHSRLPKTTSIERSPLKRPNKIYLDFLQNRRGQTLTAPYSLRPWPGATVSTPLHWHEVKKGLDPAKFNIRTIFKRIERHGDLWKPMLTQSVDLEEAIELLRKHGTI